MTFQTEFTPLLSLLGGVLIGLSATMLMAFHGRIAGMLWQNLQGLFEPMLQYLRRFIPPYRGFDWSVMVLYLLI